jgi:hypothetical protein
MEQPDRIVGYEVAHSLVDEIDTMATDKARNAWNKIIARNRQKCGMQNTVGVATTPEGFKFVWERWQNKPAPGYVLFRAKTRENAANLPPNYISDLEASYATRRGCSCRVSRGRVRQPHLGQRLSAVRSRAQRAARRSRPSEPLHIGQDFNVGNMASVVFVLRDGDPHAVDELTGIARHAGADCDDQEPVRRARDLRLSRRERAVIASRTTPARATLPCFVRLASRC